MSGCFSQYSSSSSSSSCVRPSANTGRRILPRFFSVATTFAASDYANAALLTNSFSRSLRLSWVVFP